MGSSSGSGAGLCLVATRCFRNPTSRAYCLAPLEKQADGKSKLRGLGIQSGRSVHLPGTREAVFISCCGHLPQASICCTMTCAASNHESTLCSHLDIDPARCIDLHVHLGRHDLSSLPRQGQSIQTNSTRPHAQGSSNSSCTAMNRLAQRSLGIDMLLWCNTERDNHLAISQPDSDEVPFTTETLQN